MFAMIEQYQNSKLPRQTFCDQQGIAKSTFEYWLRKYRSKVHQGESDFIHIDMEPVSGTNYMMEVQTRKGSYFRFSTIVPLDYLKRLMDM